MAISSRSKSFFEIVKEDLTWRLLGEMVYCIFYTSLVTNSPIDFLTSCIAEGLLSGAG